MSHEVKVYKNSKTGESELKIKDILTPLGFTNKEISEVTYYRFQSDNNNTLRLYFYDKNKKELKYNVKEEKETGK